MATRHQDTVIVTGTPWWPRSHPARAAGRVVQCCDQLVEHEERAFAVDAGYPGVLGAGVRCRRPTSSDDYVVPGMVSRSRWGGSSVAGVRQFDEREALERALDVFEDRGFGTTSMLDLAAGTGVQRGSLYHAYGGKEEIFVRAFREYTGRFLARAAEALSRPDKRSALLSFLDFCLESITAGSPSRGCLSTRTAVEAATESGRARTAVRTFLDELETVVHDGLAAIDDGAELQVDLRAAARLIVTSTRGLAVLERVGHSLPELRAIAEALVTSLLGPPPTSTARPGSLLDGSRGVRPVCGQRMSRST
jgi:TetR/AcrR family transcriptional repressor of nem operon